MIENTKINILCGGYYVCTPKWDRDRTSHAFHDTFDFLLPLAKGMTIETTGGIRQINPGYVYYTPGRHIVRRSCKGEVPVYWVATVSESFYLRRRLAGIRTVHAWPLASISAAEGVFRRFVEFFEEEKLDNDAHRTDDDSRPRKNSPAGLGVKIEATLMYLMGDLMEATEKDFSWGDHDRLDRLKPSIDYMDEHFLRNPQLAEIARQSGIAPEYFHRMFKQETGATPFNYMLEQRMNRARHLLWSTSLSIKEVADAAGYADSFYFSRLFTKQFRISPSAFREERKLHVK